MIVHMLHAGNEGGFAMKRLVGQVVLVASLVLAGACTTQDNATVFVKFNQPFTMGCTIGDGSGNVFTSSGRLDVTNPLPGSSLLNPGYIMGPAMQNVATPTAVAPEAHKFFVHGADVELRSNGSPDSNTLVAGLTASGLDQRTQYFSGIVEAGATSGIIFNVIDNAQTERINQLLQGQNNTQVIAHFRIFGTIDGNDVKTDPFDYPIAVCLGCAINDVGPCASIQANDPRMFSPGGTCNPMQDGTADCCELGGAALMCPAVKPTM